LASALFPGIGCHYFFNRRFGGLQGLSGYFRKEKRFSSDWTSSSISLSSIPHPIHYTDVTVVTHPSGMFKIRACLLTIKREDRRSLLEEGDKRHRAPNFYL